MISDEKSQKKGDNNFNKRKISAQMMVPGLLNKENDLDQDSKSYIISAG